MAMCQAYKSLENSIVLENNFAKMRYYGIDLNFNVFLSDTRVHWWYRSLNNQTNQIDKNLYWKCQQLYKLRQEQFRSILTMTIVSGFTNGLVNDLFNQISIYHPHFSMVGAGIGFFISHFVNQTRKESIQKIRNEITGELKTNKWILFPNKYLYTF